MLINIKNKNDLITIDFSIKQIRYLKDFDKQGEIFFIELSNDDCVGYEYLFENDKYLFKKSIKEDLFSYLGIKVFIKDLKSIKLEFNNTK